MTTHAVPLTQHPYVEGQCSWSHKSHGCRLECTEQVVLGEAWCAEHLIGVVAGLSATVSDEQGQSGIRARADRDAGQSSPRTGKVDKP